MKHLVCITAALVLAFTTFGTPKAQSSINTTSGCNTVDVVKPAHSWIFHTNVYHFHVLEHWCWKGKTITSITSGCYADHVSSVSFNYNGCKFNTSWYYKSGGSPKGGHFTQAQGSFGNCAFHIGCFGNHYPIIRIWVKAGGGWTSDPLMNGGTSHDGNL